MAKLLTDPDPILVKDQLAAIKNTLATFGVPLFCAMFFWILPKNSKIIPFRFKPQQEHLYSHMHPVSNRVLKERQSGMTTYFLLVRILLNIITNGGKNGLLINYNSRYATETFVMLRRAYRLIGALDPYDNTRNEFCLSLRANLLHTAYSNRRELVFDQLDSKILVESAEVEEAGQSVTLHHVVADEVARWPHNPEATASNIRGALVPGGTYDEISTANGAGGYMYERCIESLEKGDTTDAKFHFYAWWHEFDYRMDLTPAEAEELENDLTADELRIISKMHKELAYTAHLRA